MARDDALSELRSVPPKQFTRARDALAKKLRDEGNDTQAREVKQLKKPSASVWAANALAREKPEVMRDLLDAGAALRLAQRKTLSGAGGPAQMKEAMRELQSQVRRATNEGVTLLRDAGESTSAAVTDRLRETLLAGAEGDDDVREALRTGTLEDDLSAAGFGMVTPLRVVTRAAPGAKKPTAAELEVARAKEARERKAAALAEAQARKAAAHARKQLTIAEREFERLDHAAKVAEENARTARKAAFEASQRLEAARRAVGPAADL